MPLLKPMRVVVIPMKNWDATLFFVSPLWKGLRVVAMGLKVRLLIFQEFLFDKPNPYKKVIRPGA